MSIQKMGQGEVKHVDVTSPFRAHLFPILELVLITGVLWILIGWLDVQVNQGAIDLALRNGVVLLWSCLALWRFVLPVFRQRRKRFIVTNRRVIARAPTMKGQTDSIPLGDIVGVRRRRGGISLAIRGYERAIHFPDVPKTKRIEKILNQQIAELRSPIWR
ncbi:hypothetical protein ACG98H_03905 [Corynebacterium sp. L4756]|uniref:hypothetical protein n=1 Tax=unclassified Corynebacterium TaxID=2624378 RepID=UPI00374CD855